MGFKDAKDAEIEIGTEMNLNSILYDVGVKSDDVTLVDVENGNIIKRPIKNFNNTLEKGRHYLFTLACNPETDSYVYEDHISMMYMWEPTKEDFNIGNNIFRLINKRSGDSEQLQEVVLANREVML